MSLPLGGIIMMSKEELLRQNLENDACAVSNLIAPKKEVTISLDEECSKETILISSAFNMLIG